MPNFSVVIVGGDLGAYALAREFNDAYGVKPILVSAYNTFAIRDSQIVQRHYFADADKEESLVEELLGIGARIKEKRPSEPVLLLANTDWRIQVLASYRDRLEAYFEITIPEKEIIDQVSDKQRFAHLAAESGMKTPDSYYEDFSRADDSNWKPKVPVQDMRFPVVAKPADSFKYENILFEGRKKVYRIDSGEELLALWEKLRVAKFRGTFMAQQLVEGDDTQMYSVTAYVNSRGKVSMLCSAHVLLEEHHPATLGNPCAMITEVHEELARPVRIFLKRCGYRGFANFDVKRDPQTGEFFFLEVNPRIGRNSFYCVGAGTNPMRVLVDDVVYGNPRDSYPTNRVCLYRVVPRLLVARYILDPQLRDQLGGLEKTRHLVNPLVNPKDNSWKRRWYRYVQGLSHWRKFLKYYPKPTDTGF